jgi:hypothetical protein
MSKETMYSADSAYQAELVRVYGKQATDARYDPQRNAATPELHRLREEKIAADDKWIKKMRNEA